jgi:predicted membrane protein
VTTRQVIELVLALVLLALGVWQYSRRSADGARYGSQGAVLLFAAAALLAIHGLGLMEYRPSRAELGQ